MNIRWDDVVNSNAFRVSRRVLDAAAVAPEVARAGASVELQVWLFGMIAGSNVANPLVLQFSGACALCDVFDELGRRLGSEFLRTLVGENGELLNTCRVFLNGEPAKDKATPISGAAAATVEIILFREIEGG